ncbi:MAG: GNAT family N-acetyltransferase [Acidimicrobiales bacterium]
MPAVREAEKTDVRAVADALTLAFADDPLMGYMLPRAAKRPKQMTSFFRNDIRRALSKGIVYTTRADEIAGGAIWISPGRWKTGGVELIGQVPVLLAFGRDTRRALDVLGRVEKIHPKEPHWYLAVLGTRPAQQGHGIGSALMHPVLDLCDKDGIAAYLESSKEANIPFYRRHGFEVTGEVAMKDGPSVWPMWRDPR